MKQILTFLLILSVVGCNPGQPDAPINENSDLQSTPKTEAINLQILATYPHDTGAYTQGLEWYNGKLYESTGDYEKSSLRITDVKTGKVEFSHVMGSKDIFGEGMTILNGKLYQLTWQSHLVYVYDLKDLSKPVRTFNWPYEGWGITHFNGELIVSDGSSNIYFVDPETFRVKSTRQVTDGLGPVNYLNELEMVGNSLYANVYMQDYIVRIDPSNGHVTGKIQLPGLIQQYAPGYTPQDGEVLNGMAYDSSNRKFYITGKRWPKLFETVLP